VFGYRVFYSILQQHVQQCFGTREDKIAGNISRCPVTAQSGHHAFWPWAIRVIDSIQFDGATSKAKQGENCNY